MNTIALKEVCDFLGDGDWIESKDQSDSGIRLIQTGNIGIGRFKDRIEKARWISEETFRNLRCTEIIEGDVLVSRLPDPVGRACLIPSLNQKAITAVDCAIIRFDGSRLIPKFFIYYSQSNEYYSTIRPLISGSTRERISREKLANLLIPYPSILEQKIIVEKLDKAFAELHSLEKNLQLKEEKTNQLLQSMLSAAFTNTEEFDTKIVKLESIVDILDNLRQPINSTERSGRIGKIPYYGATGQVGTIDKAIFNEDLLLLGEDGVPFFDRNKHKAYEISGPAWVNNHAHVLRAKISKVKQKYLLYFLNNFNYSGYVNGATRLKLTQGDMKRIPVPLPSLVKQEIIVEKLDKAFAEIEKLKNKIWIEKDKISSLRQSILSNAFKFEEKAN